uniref:DUF4064 domain-containing protein n=1 Tax=uncultured Nocardioidaceae bacterium TaxID=253824 RepID=A0A6J4MI49_9ACTN|nr:MAG: hypothetical protein AVDCRST_MAG46-3216 [uncultured Nocardioidaceae bacterium]
MEPVSTGEARPQAVTRACLLAGTGSVLTLITVFGILSDWGSLEIQEQVDAALARSPVPGVGTDGILEIIRVILMVIAVFAVAGLVLSIYTARRDRSARVALMVLSAGWMPVALVFGVVGVLFALMAALTLALLWRPESRRWFKADSAAPDLAPPPTQEPASMSTPPPQLPPGHGGYPPFGSPPGSGPQGEHAPVPGPSTSGPAPYGPPYEPSPYGPPQYGQPPYGPVGWQVPESRPTGVTAAAVITVVGAGLAALIGGLISLAFLLARDSFEEGVAQELDGFSASEQSLVVSVVGWYFIGCTLLALVAIVLGVLLLRDRHRVRVPLVVMSAITALLGVPLFPFGLLWSAAAISVIILLFAGSAGAWFDLRNHRADQQRASY